MSETKINKLLHSPFANKMLAAEEFYWRAKTRIYYRFLFKSFGRGSVIRRPMLISNGDCIEIEDNVSIRDGIRLEAIRDRYGRTPSVKIGSNTLIEQGVQIVCHGRVKIGRDVSITGRCAIVDVHHPYEDINLANIGTEIANVDSFVEIADGAFLGYGSVILPNVRVGTRSVVGANSVVTCDVPDYSIAAGAPAKIVKVYSPALRRWVQPASD